LTISGTNQAFRGNLDLLQPFASTSKVIYKIVGQSQLRPLLATKKGLRATGVLAVCAKKDSRNMAQQRTTMLHESCKLRITKPSMVFKKAVLLINPRRAAPATPSFMQL